MSSKILRLDRHIGLPPGSMAQLETVHRGNRDPVTVLGAYLGDADDVRGLAAAWRWSAEDRKRGVFAATWMLRKDFDAEALVARDGFPASWVAEVMRGRGDMVGAQALLEWAVPVFPVRRCRSEGGRSAAWPRKMGAMLERMKVAWAASGFTADRHELIASEMNAPEPRQ